LVRGEITSGQNMAASKCTPSGGRLRKVSGSKVNGEREPPLFSKKLDAPLLVKNCKSISGFERFAG